MSGGTIYRLPQIGLRHFLRVRGPAIRQIARYGRRGHEPCGGTGLVRVLGGVRQCGCGPWILHLEVPS